MKKSSSLLLALILTASCQSRKPETAETVPVDSSVINNAVQADQPATSSLAFEEMKGFVLDKKVTFTDSVNYLLLTSQADFSEKFVPNAEAPQPDFIINYIIAVACAPTQNPTHIMMENAEVDGSTLNLYLTIHREPKGTNTLKPAAVFSVEKRDGVTAIQFFLNGTKDKELMVAGM